MLLRLVHRTTFVYAGQARDSFNEVRLHPVNDNHQTCRRYELRVDPEVSARAYTDFYGNQVQYFDITTPHHRLVVEAESEIETVPDDARRPIPLVPFEELAASAERDQVAEFAASSHYVPLDVEVWREAQDALADGLGLCRCMQIPARYVSGYFLNRHRRRGEIEASHAWVEAYIPGYGWAAYDPTHDRPANDHYIKVAVGRDYADIRPVSGTYRGAATRELRVAVRVREAASPATLT